MNSIGIPWFFLEEDSLQTDPAIKPSNQSQNNQKSLVKPLSWTVSCYED